MAKYLVTKTKTVLLSQIVIPQKMCYTKEHLVCTFSRDFKVRRTLSAKLTSRSPLRKVLMIGELSFSIICYMIKETCFRYSPQKYACYIHISLLDDKWIIKEERNGCHKKIIVIAIVPWEDTKRKTQTTLAMSARC